MADARAGAPDRPGVIAPPPLILLAALLIGWVIAVVWPVRLLGPAAGYALAAVCGVAGITVGVWCALLFRRAGTSLEPWRSSTALVVTGPYRYSRNPVYIAQILVYLAVALAVDNGWMLATLVPAVLIFQVGVVQREERYLESKFGDAYRRYKATVRRWL